MSGTSPILPCTLIQMVALACVGAVVLNPRGLFAQEPEPDRPRISEPPMVEAEEVTVTATRLETPLREVGSSVTVITARELEQRQIVSVAEALRAVPGLSVVQTAGRAGVASVFLRGAKSEQTLVLLDGIVLNDPISPGRAFDFFALDVSNVERIEVIRGPQSTLYGSDAMGGVVQIITKKGAGPPQVTVSAEAGSFETLNAGAGFSGSQGAFDYSLWASRQTSAGISAADEDRGFQERDGYTKTNLSGRWGWAASEALSFDLFLRLMDTESELDQDYGSGIEDDPNFNYTSRQRFFRVQGTLALSQSAWTQKLGYSQSEIRREAENKRDPVHPLDASRDTFDGTIRKADWQHDLALHETSTLTLGLEAQEERGSSSSHSESAFGPFDSRFPEESATLTSAYAQDRVRIADAFFGTVGLRVDDHDRFGQEQTYRLTAAYLIGATGTKLKATYGTGFKAPTLFQLFSDFGNPDLQPERSIGWDAGLEQSLSEGTLTLGLVYFRNEFEDLIDFDFGTNRFANTGRAETRGIEAEAALRPEGPWTLDLAYTQTRTEDLSTGEPLLRRPDDQATLEATWRPGAPWRLVFSALRVGKREDFDFAKFERVTLHPYTLIALATDYSLTPIVTLFGRVENLTDADYEEVRGYGVPGRAAYAGVRATF
jgi:vitamin B12 transporter